jgi:glutaredoxin
MAADSKVREKRPLVIVYGADWCSWCHRAIEFFRKNDIAFEVRDVDNVVFAQEAMEKSGQRGIPVIVIGNDVVTGFDETRLMALLDIHLKSKPKPKTGLKSKSKSGTKPRKR